MLSILDQIGMSKSYFQVALKPHVPTFLVYAYVTVRGVSVDVTSKPLRRESGHDFSRN